MGIYETRRRNLNAYIARIGGQSVFIDKTGMNQGQLSALQNGGRNIGEKLARKIEQQCEMPPGSLDSPGGVSTDPMDQIEAAINSADWLEPSDRNYFIGLLKSMRVRRQ